jgi:predicted ferric reductase
MTSAARRRLACALILAILLAVPLAAFAYNVRGPLQYLGPNPPPGQPAYIMMRVAGHVAFVLMFAQLVVGSSAVALSRWLDWGGLVRFHRGLGLFTIGAVLSHPLLFGWGRTLRAGKEQVSTTLLPHLGVNYWETMLALGAFALYAAILAAAAAMLGRRIGERAWRIVHAMNYAAFFLAFFHAISIGSETRFPAVTIEYSILAGAAAVALLVRARRLFRAGPSPSASGEPEPARLPHGA